MTELKIFRAENCVDLEENEIREYEFLLEHTHFDPQNRPIEVCAFFPDGSLENKFEYTYNSNGLLIEEFLIESDGEITQHRTFEYGENEKIKTEYIHYQDNTRDKIEFAYDEKAFLLSRRNIDSEGEIGNYIINQYESNKLVSENEHDMDGKIISQHEIIYNSDGTIAEEMYRTADGNYNLQYSYNQTKQIILTRRFNEQKQLIERHKFHYDELGRIVELTEESATGTTTTNSTYDTRGNLLSQIETNENTEILSSIDRTYDSENRILTSSVYSNKPYSQTPRQYRIRNQYI